MTNFSSKDDSVQLVKEAADIVEIIGEHVNLKKAGTNYKGLCPFHSEKTPSFTVNPARGSYHCFGCNEGGDVFSFYMQYHNATFPEALKNLARRYNVTLPEKPLSHQDQERARKRINLYEIQERAATLFHETLLHDPLAAGARKYLEDREIPTEIISRFRLGYAPDRWDFLAGRITDSHRRDLACEAGLLVRKERGGFYDRFRDRLLCPIMNMSGQTAGFSGRILGAGQPKYMNSPESPVYDKSRLVYGLYQNREQIRKARRCLLVEGNFDLLSLAAKGFDYAAAPLGTALTRYQVRSLKGYAEEVVILFDGDAAGLKAAMKAVPVFLSEHVEARVLILPPEHDPDTFIRAHGKEALARKIETSVSLPEFVFHHLKSIHTTSVDGKARIVTEMQGIINELEDNSVEKTVFVSHFAQKLGIPPEQLVKTNAGIAPPGNADKNKDRKKTEPLTLSFKEKQFLEFLIIFPEYLQKFTEAGIEDVIIGSFGKLILKHLQESADDATGGQERLLDLAEGEERAFISELLITSPSYTDEEKEHTAAEKLGWLHHNRLKIMRENLTRQINEAHRSGDVALCMKLIEQKNSLDKGPGNQELS
ncbi:MAG: DNA primase [Proteobacteria bacterium]|nr:DNA primase [Pseudomonadota bacterium]MBU1738920.1 DNA primase [Pseudomonadota bacterium]